MITVSAIATAYRWHNLHLNNADAEVFRTKTAQKYRRRKRNRSGSAVAYNLLYDHQANMKSNAVSVGATTPGRGFCIIGSSGI